jgi:hypothetical protein
MKIVICNLTQSSSAGFAESVIQLVRSKLSGVASDALRALHREALLRSDSRAGYTHLILVGDDAERDDFKAQIAQRGLVLYAEVGLDEMSWNEVQALAEMITESIRTSNTLILPRIRMMMAEWQAKLGDVVKLDLDGSILSDTFIFEGAKVIDIDLRFLADLPQAPGLREQIEAATGLRFRKSITVNDWPEGTSTAHLLEGQLTIPESTIPIEVEGCLRNRRAINWHAIYLHVFTPQELNRYKNRKLSFRGDVERSKDLKIAMRLEARDRATARGLIAVGLA